MNFRYRLMQFMSGRYGMDTLFAVLFGIAAVLAFVNVFVRSAVLQLVVYGLGLVAFLRFFSRNIEARRRENRWAENVRQRVLAYRQTANARRADTTHIYRRCPACRATLRLPRRKGKHQTTCPKCGHSFSVRVFRGQ